jgi:hypothetical protein
MRTSKQAAAVLLAGTVAVAGGAYAIGTQTGGGSAAARGGDSSTDRTFAPEPPFDDLADALGVDPDDLRDALADFHDRRADAHRGGFAAGLADALGKSTAEVERALEQQRDDAQATFARRLAAALELDAARVEAALENVPDSARTGGPLGPGDMVEDLADELGVGADKLWDALREARPFGRDCGPGDRPAQPFSGLARALDVTPSELRKALREAWAKGPADLDRRHEELAAFLAERFDLSSDEVEEALNDGMPPWRGPHRVWRGGPPPPDGPPPPAWPLPDGP